MDALIPRPLGKLPALIEYVYAGTPPAAAKADAKLRETCPLPGAHVSESAGGAARMLMEQGVVAEAVVESCTLAVKLNNPETVGVPVIIPVTVLRFRPVGKLPRLIE